MYMYIVWLSWLAIKGPFNQSFWCLSINYLCLHRLSIATYNIRYIGVFWPLHNKISIENFPWLLYQNHRLELWWIFCNSDYNVYTMEIRYYSKVNVNVAVKIFSKTTGFQHISNSSCKLTYNNLLSLCNVNMLWI